VSALILVADADPFNLRLLQEACAAVGHRVITSMEGREVLDTVARERPDLILLDGALPAVDGFDVLQILKGDGHLSDIPVLLAAPEDALDARRRALALGAEDYVAKPYLVFEVQQRIRNTLRASAGVGGLEMEPGLGNAQQLLISLEYEFTRAARYGHPLACMVLRVHDPEDHDDGAPEGWRPTLARLVRSCVRTTDQVYGSDGLELTVLLPETDSAGARVVLDRIERFVQAESTPWGPRAELRSGFAASPDDRPTDGPALLTLARRGVRDS
jgi:two-component system, cell cycle response regulator